MDIQILEILAIGHTKFLKYASSVVKGEVLMLGFYTSEFLVTSMSC